MEKPSFHHGAFSPDMETIPVKLVYKNVTTQYESLAHMWKEWYQEYFDAEYPRLMIRLEDLVFHPYELLSSVCKCVDGEMVDREDFSLVGESSKNHGDIQGTGLRSAFSLHLYSNRTAGMSNEDIAYAENTLKDSLTSTLGYENP